MARGHVLLVQVLLLVAMVAAAPSGSDSDVPETFFVAGLKCNLRNLPPVYTDGGFVCPDGDPSTVTFCKKPGGTTVRIVGNFAAADLGVCDSDVNPLTLYQGQEVKYEQFGDLVVIRNSGSSSVRCFQVAGEKLCVGLGQRSGVSYLTDCGPAAC